MPEKIKSQLESLLLVTSKPVSVAKLVEVLKAKPKEVEESLKELAGQYNQSAGGIRLIRNNNSVQLASNPDNAELVKLYLKDDITGELTEPSLETLTIVAYRQSVSKAELEQIRGVNCSLILRNLMIRGLVAAEYDKTRAATVYSVTMDFLKHLGISSVIDLPDFEKLNSDENLGKLLDQPASQAEASEDQVVRVEVTRG